MSPAPVDERGMITAFVAGITVALLVAAGLVIDGGGILAARREADGAASAAARAGAQALDTDQLRQTGRYTLDRTAAAVAAEEFLAREGRHGDVAVAGNRVTVTVRIAQPMYVLGLAGLADTTVTGQASATLAHGVTAAEP